MRDAKLVITYEPRKLLDGDHQLAKRRHFSRAHDEFVKRFPKHFSFVTVYGNQGKTWDCEKRVIHFGFCCLPKVSLLVAAHAAEGSFPGSAIFVGDGEKCKLRVTGIFRFHIR